MRNIFFIFTYDVLGIKIGWKGWVKFISEKNFFNIFKYEDFDLKVWKWLNFKVFIRQGTLIIEKCNGSILCAYKIFLIKIFRRIARSWNFNHLLRSYEKFVLAFYSGIYFHPSHLILIIGVKYSLVLFFFGGGQWACLCFALLVSKKKYTLNWQVFFITTEVTKRDICFIISLFY